MALGLGEMTLESFLNEPLKARVDLLNTQGLHEDEIRVRLATREDFEKMGIDRAYFLTSIKFEVELDGDGKPRIVMSSDDPVLEPYLDFIVEARWPSGRLLREYTVLVDPPVFDEAAPVISASQRVEEVEGIPPEAKKNTADASSGTRVDVGKKSTLAPGAMPQRDFNAQAAARAAAGSRYMVNRNDTLWEIADTARPAGATVHQTMLEIQRLNPDAFINGNINQLKAGYIIYLPKEGEIGSADIEQARAEVRQQNEDWREGRVNPANAAPRPSLRIAADSTDDSAAQAGVDSVPSAGAAPALDAAAAAGDTVDAARRLAAMEQQVATLQRIVSLKDDQIAALQDALANQGDVAVEEGAEPEELLDEGMSGLDAEPQFDESTEPMASDDTEAQAVAVAPAAEPEAAKPAAAKKPVVTTPEKEDGGIISYALYGLGALVLALLAFFFVRRGKEEDTTDDFTTDTDDDVFADVQLKTQELDVDSTEDGDGLVGDAEIDEADEEPEVAAPGRDNRGYGERKHDEYASDVDTGDALAEADIYIAYGRYPQAVELLKNAIANEPGNPTYRLKLLELLADMGDRSAANEQLKALQDIADPETLERGTAVMAGASAASVAGSEPETPPPLEDNDAGLDLDLDVDNGDELQLEDEFGGLEIEPSAADAEELEDMEELDLTADFDENLLGDDDDDELVIAAESSGLSTKLDLARAYLDMGDEDGARQILEEVAAEGNDELKAEANALLERLG
tara:strand:- start:23722 stop:25950 length:2229 start_codon:yes stop_codon:yes gene_type:complete